LIWTAGVKGTSDAADFGLEAARGQRLFANEYMQAKGYEEKDIYIIGDLVHYEENSDGRPTPQIVQAAEQTGHTAAANIVAKIKNTPKHEFKSNYQGFMVSIGSKWGVANLMDKFHLSGFLAIVVKHLVNLLYFFTIRSGYYMFQYMMHEFFHIKNDRNVTRGHSSRYGNVLWSVPLRVFYGSMWLIESSKKIVGDGQYLNPTSWFGDGSWFTDKVVFPFPWLQEQVTTGASAAGAHAAEATTAATGAAGGATDAAATATHFGFSYAFGENPMPVFEKMPHWFANIMEVMMPNRDVALFMQKFMTFVEIGIALALIFGLFTWLASAATIGLTVVFCLSGMFYWVNIWFIFVAFALMNGSGRALGLDRWVIPWIQRKTGKWWYGTPRSIYGKNDSN
jgi:NADH dehydrogenase